MPDDASEQAPPWAWPDEVWRSAASRVRAGRNLRPSEWPQGAQVAVCISFDCDNETSALREGNLGAASLAAGAYGPRASAPRLLRILEAAQVPASFYVPAVSAMLHPEEVQAYVAAGHEIGIHGWIHERNGLLDPKTERDLTLRSLEVVERIAGRRPVGIRTPAWDFTPATIGIIREAGLLYDSSLMEDDDPYELLEDGDPSGIVEIPVEWIRDDAPYFVIARSTGMRTPVLPADVLEIWWREFLGAREEHGVFQLTMHPGVTGRRSRVWILAELLERIRATGNVWFATHEQAARYVLGAAAASAV